MRQLSSLEDDKVVFQILTSNGALRPGPVVSKLRHRWSIENFNKYAEDHLGVHWLASYEMEVFPDTTEVANPARGAARAVHVEAKTALAEKERALGRAMEARYESTDERVASINARRDELQMAKDALAEAKAALKGIPAKVVRNELDPSATRARPALATRALQMVCRLLAYNDAPIGCQGPVARFSYDLVPSMLGLVRFFALGYLPNSDVAEPEPGGVRMGAVAYVYCHVGRSSMAATGSSHEGQQPPMPTRRMNVRQSSHL